MRRAICSIMIVGLCLAASMLLATSKASSPSVIKTSRATGAYGTGLLQVGSLPGECQVVAVQGEYAYVGFGPDLAIVDISIAEYPRIVSRITMSTTVASVAIARPYAYVVITSTLSVVDISDPVHPEVTGSCSLIEGGDLAVADNYAYVIVEANRPDEELQVIDVSRPDAPIPVSFVDVPWDCGVCWCGAGGVAVADGYVYMGPECLWCYPTMMDHAFAGLAVVDVSNPVVPQWYSDVVLFSYYEIYASTPTVWDVALQGSYAYVAEMWCGLTVVDIADPANPTEISCYRSKASAVAVSGDCAYLAARDSGLVMVNISDPSSLTYIDSQLTGGYAADVAVKDGYIFVADKTEGFLVFRYTPDHTERLHLPVVHSVLRTCEESLTKLHRWEGSLEWYCDKVIRVDGQSSVRLEAEDFSNSEAYSPLIPVTPEGDYTVSYWVKTDLTVDNAEVYGRIIPAQYSDQAMEIDDIRTFRVDPGFSLGENVGGKTDWVSQTYTFTTTADTHYVRLRAPMGLVGRAKGTVWYDGVALTAETASSQTR